LGPDLQIAGASTDEVYAAMDWLVDRQDAIEKKLATKHLAAEANPSRMALFDLTSSWVRGRHCELAARGYFHPLPVAGAFASEVDAQPGVVAQLPNRRWRNEARPQQALLGELGQPPRIQLVFGRPGTLRTSRALTSPSRATTGLVRSVVGTSRCNTGHRHRHPSFL
jgi:hypothetical protein